MLPVGAEGISPPAAIGVHTGLVQSIGWTVPQSHGTSALASSAVMT